ncbi:MAG: beta-ketoacyl-[acyl-carrier-protein] synthase family protein [Syntrophales bacterium]|nr:beta-ketoacyl-[acyl-carrier-protein] synthase family protein [Syntrophales bacterium]
MTKRRVFITGYGIITSIGKSALENYASLIAGRCGIGRLSILRTVHEDEIPACEIKLEDGELCELARVAPHAGYTRTALLGLIAAREAVRTAGLTEAETRDAGFISATSSGGIREFERYYYDLRNEEKSGDFLAYLDTADPGEHAERIADQLGIRKYIDVIGTACSSSANAIMQGARLIGHGMAERVVCGGAEALNRFTVNGFNALMVLDKDHCRPFDEERKGLNLGEGAAYLVLEAEEALPGASKRAIAELTGYANVSDAFHQTASSPEGRGAFEAMKQALEAARLDVRDISYINAHGTGTENNDLSEGAAMEKLFPRGVPPFSSTKPFVGHTIAASGGIEAVFCMMALQHDIIFPNINFATPMKELGIKPVTELRHDAGLVHVLSNSFGFGGNTTSLVFSKCP